jgi:hypothetical protein
VSLGDVVDQLLNQDGLSDSGSTEKSNLSSPGVGSKEIDDLDSGLENLGRSRLVNERGRVGVDGAVSDGVDGSALVNGLSDNVNDATEAAGSDGDENGGSSVDDLLATNETLGSCQRWRGAKMRARSRKACRQETGKRERQAYRPWRWCERCSLPSASRPQERDGARSPGPRER